MIDAAGTARFGSAPGAKGIRPAESGPDGKGVRDGRRRRLIIIKLQEFKSSHSWMGSYRKFDFRRYQLHIVSRKRVTDGHKKASLEMLDKSDCENEPIRFPGSVMPHGALLVLEKRSRKILGASQTFLDSLAILPGDLFEKSFDAFLATRPEMEGVRGCVDALGQFATVDLGAARFTVRAQENESGQILIDFEPAEDDEAQSIQLLFRLKPELAALRKMTDLRATVQYAAECIRKITGYDRVMVYRFDSDWNGEVLGEACDPDAEPYLGLCFPASDIPRQARELFKTKKPRQIVDTQAIASPLLATRSVSEIDLGDSDLRSVSPVHIQYTKNMGVRATLVGSLVVDERLWGLIACHHKAGPKYFGPRAREAFGWICDSIADYVKMSEMGTFEANEAILADRRHSLVNTIRSKDFMSLINDKEFTGLIDVLNADGFAVLLEGDLETSGVTPSAEQIIAMNRARRELSRQKDFFATNCISSDLGIRADEDIAGALFVSVAQFPQTTLVWFRREKGFSINWAGDPRKTFSRNESGELTPRASFEKYIEEIHGKAPSWRPEELAAAEELASLIEIALLSKVTRELRQLSVLDPLTQAHNRRYLAQRLEDEFARFNRYYLPAAVMMIDVDHFKEINDRFGHTAGDIALVTLVDILKTIVRDADVVARYGGEEFIVVLTSTNGANAFQVAQRIRATVEEASFNIEGGTLKFTVSCGISEFSTGDSHWGDVIERADKTLYQAKNSGRNKVVNFESSKMPGDM